MRFFQFHEIEEPAEFLRADVEQCHQLGGERQNGKKTLNDKLKIGGLNIGLNDKIAFIKHLFDGNNTDYDRVISQINTSNALSEAKDLIYQMIKPDYNNWEGKEEYEERFVEIVEGRFS